MVDEDGIGKVTVMEIHDGAIPDDGMIACVLDAFEGLQVDPPNGHGDLAVTYPLVFASTDMEEP